MKKKELIYVIALIVIVVLVIIGVSNSKKNNNPAQAQNRTTQSQTAEQTTTKTGEISHINGDTSKYAEEQQDGSKVNTSGKMLEDRQYKNLKITNSRVTEINGITTLLADVQNVGDTAITDMTLFDIVFVDEEDHELATLVGSIIPLEPGQTTQLNSGITEDIAGAYTYRIIEHQE